MELMEDDDVQTTTDVLKTTIFTLATATPIQNAELKLYDYLIPAIGALVIILNLAVVVSSGLILKRGQQPRTTYLFLGNMAMADLVTGIAVVMGQVFPPKYRDIWICAVQIGMIVCSTLASVYSIGLIAIDRYLYIIHGLKYQQWVYPKRARIWIGATWFIGIIVAFLPALLAIFGWRGDTQNGKICWFIKLASKNVVILTVVVGVIPMITVIVLYMTILYHAIKKIIHIQRSVEDANQRNPPQQQEAENKDIRMFRGSTKSVKIYEEDVNPSIPSNKKSSSTSPSKWKAIKVVLFTSGGFLFTWGPYFIISLVHTLSCSDQENARCKHLSVLIASPLAILGFMNSLINPIIYAWWHKGFRTFVSKRWNSLRGRKMSLASKEATTSSTRKMTISSANLVNNLENDAVTN